MLITRICGNCNAIFNISSPNQRYCSIDCSIKAQKDRQRQYSRRCYIKNPGYFVAKDTKLRKALTDYFFKKYCEVNDDHSIPLYFFYNCFKSFCSNFNFIISRSYFIIYLKKKGFKTNLKNTLLHGIKFNRKGVGKYEKSFSKKVSHKEACILKSCKPGQNKLKIIYENIDENTRKNIDYENTLKCYKIIESILFKLNKTHSWRVKIAAALYLGNNLSQTKCADIAGCCRTGFYREIFKTLKGDRDLSPLLQDIFKKVRGLNQTV